MVYQHALVSGLTSEHEKSFTHRSSDQCGTRPYSVNAESSTLPSSNMGSSPKTERSRYVAVTCSVGQPPTITHRLELPTVEVCPLSVGASLADLTEPMGCLDDTDQFVFADRIELDHPTVDLQEKITLSDLIYTARATLRRMCFPPGCSPVVMGNSTVNKGKDL